MGILDFMRKNVIQEVGDDIRLIDDAFSVIDNKKNLWDEYDLIYEAEFSGEQKKELEQYNLSSVFAPVARDCIDVIAGQFISAFFSGKSPIEFTGKEKDKISALNTFISQELYRAKPMTELQAVFLNTLIYGFGCAMIRWDDKERIPITTCLPIDAFALDPRATNIKDSKYCCYRQAVSIMDAKAMYPKADIQGADYERVEVKEIYKLEYLKVEEQTIKIWRIKTFIENNLVKEDYTTRLPFFYGYAIRGVVKRKRSVNEKSIGYFGKSLIQILKNHQNEINKKRNQKLRADDNAINPRIVYEGDFPFEITQMGAGSAKRASNKDGFVKIDGAVNINVDRDIDILTEEARRASGVSSINMGVTGASDRRSATALQIIAASSGVRVETMINTVLETLFDNWASGFVNEIKSRGSNSLLQLIDTTQMKINFGSQVASAARLQDLMQVLQISSQDQTISPRLKQSVMFETLSLLLGKDYDPSEFFQNEDNNPQSYGGL